MTAVGSRLAQRFMEFWKGSWAKELHIKLAYRLGMARSFMTNLGHSSLVAAGAWDWSFSLRLLRSCCVWLKRFMETFLHTHVAV